MSIYVVQLTILYNMKETAFNVFHLNMGILNVGIKLPNV